MSANPVLAHVMRGNLIENYHRGAFCFVDSSGEIISSFGNVENLIFPHSAIKSIQALAIYHSGAKEKYSLNEQEIALICASHFATKEHVEIVKNILHKIGCDISDLACGAHAPIDVKARKSLFAAGIRPSAVHNACSGKHAGMLAVARALNIEIKDYTNPKHEVQRLVQQMIENIIGEELTEYNYAIDGCSVPTWAASLKSFAFGFAKMSSGELLSKQERLAVHDIFNACVKYPHLIRGENSLDSDLMAAFGGRLIIKIGSDGVFCGVFREENIGFALKIDDGNLEVAEVVIANMLLELPNLQASEVSILQKYRKKTLYNWRKIAYGKIVKP